MISIKSPSYYVLFVVSMLLLSFSSSPSDGAVITYAAPFLFVSCLLFISVFINDLAGVGFRFLIWPILFVLVIFITSFIAVAPLPSLSRAFTNLLGLFIFLGLNAASMRQRVSVESTARVLFLSGSVLAIYFILNLIYKSYIYGFQKVILERYVGGAMSLPWGASNTIAQVLLLSIASYLAIETKNRWDALLLLLICSAIVLTFSRSIILLLVCMIYIILGVRRFFLLVGGGLALLAAYYTLFSAGFKGYETFMSTRLSFENMQNGNGRVATALEKLHYFVNHPFDPIGYYSSIYKFSLSAHNYWITTLVEQSVLSVLISLIFFWTVGVMASKTSRTILFGYLVVMMGLMVEDPNFVQPYIIAFWVYLSVVVSRGLSLSAVISSSTEKHAFKSV